MHRGAWWATVHGVAESDMSTVPSVMEYTPVLTWSRGRHSTRKQKERLGRHRAPGTSFRKKELLPSHSPSLAEGGNFFFFGGSSPKPFLAESVPATSEKVPEELLSYQFHSFPQSYRRTLKPLAIILKAWKSQRTELAATSISEPWILLCHPLLRDIQQLSPALGSVS